MYPTGAAGIALLLLRIELAVLLCWSASPPGLNWQTLCSGVVALALLLGIFNGVAAGAAVLDVALVGATGGLPFKLPLALHALTAAVACMLGPGGFSVDARLFGHRVIRLGR